MSSEVGSDPSIVPKTTERLIQALSEYGVLPPRLSPEVERVGAEATPEAAPAQ